VFEKITPEDVFEFLSKQKETIKKHYLEIEISDDVLKFLAKNAN
jgi:hypothetical protein